MRDATGNDLECDDTGVLGFWADYLEDEGPRLDQPSGVEVVAADQKPTLFAGLGGLSETVTARAAATATIQSISRIGSPMAICADRGTKNAIDILRTDPGGQPIYNPDGTVDIDTVKAENLGSFSLQHSQAPNCE